MAEAAVAFLRGQSRWSRWETAFWLAWVAAFFVPAADLALLAQVLVWGLFALSLDVVLGWRGVASLGHAAFFGIGAYTAGFLGQRGWHEPISGLVVAAFIAGLVGLAAGRVVRGLNGVALLMVTLGLNLLLYDFVQRATAITGGDDGMQGIQIAPVLGIFRFDMQGRTAYVYTLVVVFVLFLLVRALLQSTWGLALRGARDNLRRMTMLGAPVTADLTWAFGISAALAGTAGALLTQTTQFVAPEALSFTRSADLLVILVIGGTAVLYGGFVGALVFLLLRDQLAAMNPIYWYFWIGLLLVLIVSFFRSGIVPTVRDLLARRRGGGTVSTAVLQTRGLAMAFGGLEVFKGLDFTLLGGERHAVIGPNGAGKSTFVAIVTGLLAPTAGSVLLDGRDVTRATPRQRVAGLVRTFQINTLFASLTPLESALLALAERDGVARPSLRAAWRCAPQVDEAAALLERFGLADVATTRTDELPYGRQRVLEVALACALRPRVLLLDEPAAGLSTAQGHALFEQLTVLVAGTAVLFIEHDMNLVFGYAERVSVFAGGAVLAQGRPDEIRAHAGVRKAYLGT